MSNDRKLAQMTYPLYLIFALLPSLVWLSFYLRKDTHPESNRMIVKIFFWGMAAAIPAALMELGFYSFSEKLPLSKTVILSLNIFLGVALVEEFVKYLVVREKVIKNPEFDEPIDIMLYMIISALGFAALENILVLFPSASPFFFFETLTLSISRFVGATFLHALASGIFGYFLALSFFETRRRTSLITTGLAIAATLHGLYNFSIIVMEGSLRFIIPIIILISLAIFVSFGFRRLRKLKSVCKI